jgi:hypothetical protein
MNAADSLILITPDAVLSTVTATQAARARRDELLAVAATVTTITDEIDADSATTTMKELKAFKELIETQRELAKAPVLATSRSIDALARELSSQVIAAYDRISRVLGEFEAVQRRKREDAKRAADAEAAKIAETARREADAIRAQAAKLPPSAVTESQVTAKVEAVEQKAITAMVQTRQAAHNIAPRAAGTALNERPNYEVTDMAALYAANPTLCTVTDNRRAILAILKDNPNIQIPGIRHWRDAKANVR